MFRTFCDNKGCMKETEPVIEKGTMDLYCTECNKTINSVTDFMKRQLLASNQIKTKSKQKMAWAVKCNKCEKEAPPKVVKNKLVCASCDEELTNLSKPFAETIKEAIKLKNKND